MVGRTLRSNTQQKQYADTLMEISQTPPPPKPTKNKSSVQGSKRKTPNSPNSNSKIPKTFAVRPSITTLQTNMFPDQVQTAFKIMDSVHDIFDRPGVAKKVFALLKTTPASRDQEDQFCELVFGFRKLMGKSTFSQTIRGPRTPGGSQATTFKGWMKHYLEMDTKKSVPLKMLKEMWKIQIFTLALSSQWAFLTMGVTSPWLPYLEGATDRILTKKVAASYISAYDILLATDALKTNDQLKTEQNRSTLALPKLARNIGKSDVSKNYICNMAQIIDPANNIKKNRTYRFAFPPMIDITSETYVGQPNNDAFSSMRRRVDTNVSRVYQLVTVNVQLTCSFHIAIEICMQDDGEKVIRQLKAHAESKSQGDLLTSPMLANDFFKYVRVFVVAKPKSMLDKTNFYNFASVRGLCIQTPDFKLVNRSIISPHYVTVYALSGFSVDNVISFMQKDVPVPKVQSTPQSTLKPNQRAQLTRDFNTWLVRYYLDWKRMGDSFQITHLKDLMLANQRLVAQATNDAQRTRMYHPYHFISIDILAIVQCIMYDVHFIYEKSDNAYVIGNNILTNQRFLPYQLKQKERIDRNIQKQKNLVQRYENMENAAGTLLSFSNNNNSNTTRNDR
tara:strand:- start:93 stop:1946 length:1854 start_codon:yes stop_codon:yes gene_type:complete